MIEFAGILLVLAVGMLGITEFAMLLVVLAIGAMRICATRRGGR